MRKILAVLFCLAIVSAANAEIGDQFTITNFRITSTGAWIGNLPLTGNFTLDGLEINVPSAEVVISSPPSTGLTITDRYMIIGATGTLYWSARPIISTITHTQGTVVTLINDNAGVITLADEGEVTGTRLSLGSATRALGIRDNITLRLRNDYWEELSFTNNQ